MIKYHYDDEKKHQFLSFWDLREITEWDSFSKNLTDVFLKAVGFEERLKKNISFLFNQSVLEGKAKITKEKIKFSKTIATGENGASTVSKELPDSKIMRELDSLNMITYSKGSPLTRNVGDSWTWNEWVIAFWQGFNVFPSLSAALEYHQDVGPEDGFSLDANEERNLADVFEALVFDQFLNPAEEDLASLAKLYAKKIVFFFFLYDGKAIAPAVVINPRFLTSKESHFLMAKFNKKSNFPPSSLAKVVLYLDKIFFEEKTKSKIGFLEIKFKEEQKQFLSHLAASIQNQQGEQGEQGMERYLASDFKQKINSMVKVANWENEFYLKKLILFKEQFPLNKISFVFLLKKIFHEITSKRLPSKKIEELMMGLNFLGIIYEKKSLFYLSEAYQSLGELKSGKCPRPSKMIIDIDMSITIFKKDLSEEVDYYLSLFTQKHAHTYSAHFELDVRLSKFAWFLNFDYPKMVRFFEKYGAETFSSEFREYLKLFFENCDFYREKKLYSLLIASTIEYNKLKFHFMHKEPHLEVVFDDQRKTVIFFNQEHYQLFIEANKSQKTFKIF